MHQYYHVSDGKVKPIDSRRASRYDAARRSRVIDNIRKGPAPSPEMPARPMPHVGGGRATALPLDDGRPVQSSGGAAAREQPYGHVVHEYDEATIRPLGARVIVRLVPDDDVSPSGLIVVPAAAKQRPTRGRVVAVGPGRELPSGKRVPIDLRRGDLVYFSKWAEVPVYDQRNQDHTLVAVSQEEILCVVEADEGALPLIEAKSESWTVFERAQKAAAEILTGNKERA